MSELINKLLFVWDSIPDSSESNNVLLSYLSAFGVSWISKAYIEKVDDGNTIKIFTDDKNSLTLKLNLDKTKAILEVDDGRTAEFDIINKNSKIGVYIKASKILPFFDMPNDNFVRLCLNIVGDDGVVKTHPIDTFYAPPVLKRAWEVMSGYLKVLNNNRKQQGKPDIIYEPEELKTVLKSKIAGIMDEYSIRKSERDKRKEKKRTESNESTGQQTEFKEESKGIKCPKCGNVLCLITVGVETTLKCTKCGYEETKKPDDRLNDFIPYSIVKEDSDGNPIKIIDITNFNVIFRRILQVDNDARIINGIFNCKNTLGNKFRLQFDAKEAELSNLRDFEKFVPRYSNRLYFDRKYTKDLMTLINADKTRQYDSGITVIEERTQNFGWSNDFTAFLTPNEDYVLKKNDNGEFAKNHIGQFELRDFMEEYCEKYDIDRINPDPDETAPSLEGSVKILNSKIANSIRLGFTATPDIKDTLVHIRNTLLELDSAIDRIISIVFLSPLTSILHELGMTYQIYLQGRTGFGKSASAVLLMNFFADVSKDGLTNALRDTVNAIEEIGYYHKDCLFVIDNYKETEMKEKGKKESVTQLLQSTSDLQGVRRMSQSGFDDYRIRGCVLVTGEEKWSDASTIRKYDTITLSRKISGTMMDECFIWKNRYSDVTAKYIQWLMRNYGVHIKNEIERRVTKQKQNFCTDSMLFPLNMVGYELMLDFMIYNKVISVEEYQKMYNEHLDILKKNEIYKDQYVLGKTTGEKCLATMRAMLYGKTHIIYKDPEYNIGNGRPIGKAVGDSCDIAFNPDMYGEVYAYAKNHGTDLPSQWDSVLPELKKIVEDNDYNIKILSVKMPDLTTGSLKKQPEKPLVIPRALLFPESVYMMPTINDIVTEVLGYMQYTMTLTEPPTKDQYHKIKGHMLKMLPNTKESFKEEYLKDVEMVLRVYCKGKFGDIWEKP